MSYYIYLA